MTAHSNGDSNGDIQMQPVPEQKLQKQQAQRQYCVTRFALRTKLIDDKILEALHEHRMPQHRLLPVKQVVVLGAGMDTRPWRLTLPEGDHIHGMHQAEMLLWSTDFTGA